MSKNTTTGSKKFFSYMVENDIPTLKKVPTEWDLKTLFYTSENDPQLEKDIQKNEKACLEFAKKYQKKNFTASKSALLIALKDYEKILKLGDSKPAYYLSLRLALDSQDTKAEQNLNILEQRLTKVYNELIFFTLKIGKITKKEQKEILKDERFADYKFFLHGIFESAKHTLSEPEERILSLKSMTSRGMWIAGTEKILGAATVKVGGKELPLNGALMEMLDAPWKRRHELWKACSAKLKEIGPVAENELNALITDKKISDELRGYEKPYSATVMGYDNSEKSLETLTDVITTKGYALSRKYFKLKRDLLGKELSFIDRNQKLGELPEVSYETAITICRDAFYGFNKLYGQLFDEMVTNGHIDAFPKKGKGGGAFCASSTGVPTVVLLNHANDFVSTSTIAHEMGHAMHAYRSKTQSVFYDGHSTVTAETASTFFEAVVGNALLGKLEGKQKILLLDALISGKIDTMMMCIARYSAELEMHNTIRQQGSMTWQDMSAVLAKHLRKYCGPAITVDDADGLSVISKTHYRRNFYQYTYSFGEIASSIMYNRYAKDSSYAEKVDTFLCAGDKDSVENIFKEIGIDTTKPAVFEEGLSLLEDQIKEFTALVKKAKK